MTKVLVITGILPVSTIEHKKSENDILLVTEDEIKIKYHDFIFNYIFVFPYANKILAKFSEKWNGYFELAKNDTYLLRGRSLILLPIFLFPKRVFFRNLLVEISLFIHRKRIETIISKFKPTMLHAQSSDVDAFIAKRISKRYNIPYIVTLRGLHLGADNTIKRNLKQASSLVAVSPKQLSAGLKLTNKEIIFIPHGVKESFFVKDFKKDINYPIRLITVSRLLKLKNIDLVIQCLVDFKDKFIFDIYGDGPEMENLYFIIQRLGLQNNVFLKGFIANEALPDKFGDYDLFVMPSYPEGLGRVYFEAMASGIPVLASKDTGIDGVINNHVEGFLINHRSIEELKSVFELINDNPNILTDYGKKARILAEEYKWNNISKKYQELYTKS